MRKLILTVFVGLFFTANGFAQNIKRPDTYNYNRGVECLGDGAYRDAYDYFQSELSENPKNGYAYLWMGYIYYQSGLYGDGLAALEKAQTLIPKKDKEYYATVFQMRGDLYAEIEEYDEALENYGKAIKTTPKNTDFYKDRAELYFSLNQFDLAEKDFDKILELEPNNYLGLMGKGRNALRQNKYEAAIALFDKVVLMNGKNYSGCYSFRAETYATLKQYEKAADDVVAALAIDNDSKAFYIMSTILADSAQMTMVSKLKIQQLREPNAAQWPYCIGVVYEENQQYDKAIEYYQKANGIDASDVTCNRISDCYYEMGDYDNALLNIIDATQLDPSYTRYVFIKANIEYEIGNKEAALEDINACIEAQPDYAFYYYRKGFFEDNWDMTDDAIEDYSMSIMIDPDFFYAYLGRGDKYMKKGMVKEAEADYRMVVEKDTIPSESSCAQFAFLSLGEKDNAVGYMQRVIDSFPSDKGSYYDASCLYARMGETEIALDYLRQAFEKGYRRFVHVENDEDLEIVRTMPEYQELVAEYLTSKMEGKGIAQADEVVVEIPFSKINGVTEVQCSVNGLPLHFVFDTGASDVTISMVEATFMFKNKYLSPLDVIGKQHYLTADGNVSEGTVVNLKSVKVGDLELTNVRASVSKSQYAPLLLGQSVLGRLGKIEIDNEKKVIQVTGK